MKKKFNQNQTHEVLHYDVETAIKVCRSAGYREHALLLAKKHNEYNWYLKIQIEDFAEEPYNRNYKRALKFIESLPFDYASKCLKEYGKILVTKIPKRATNVLIRLCTDYFPIPLSETDRTLYANNRERKLQILSATETNKPTKEEHLWAGILKFTSGAKQPTTNESNIDALMNFVQSAKPENYLHAFTTQKYWLMVFLENVILRNPRNPPQSKIIYNTLLELYFNNGFTNEEKSSNEDDDDEMSSGIYFL